MKKIISKALFAVLLLLVVSLFPSSSSAYSMTEQTAVQLDEQTFLFTITYKLSFMNYEIHVPIGAKRNAEYGGGLPHLGYDFYTDKGVLIEGGDAYAVVLSGAKVAQGHYFVPNSKADHFTLLALLKLPGESKTAKSVSKNVHMRITTLPFTLVKSMGEAFPSQVDKKQLVPFRTNPINIEP